MNVRKRLSMLLLLLTMAGLLVLATPLHAVADCHDSYSLSGVWISQQGGSNWVTVQYTNGHGNSYYCQHQLQAYPPAATLQNWSCIGGRVYVWYRWNNQY